MNDDTSVDAQRAEANKDDWHLVTDTKKRKQIQDRLAQRGRRKRLREAVKDSKQVLADSALQVTFDRLPDDQFLRQCKAPPPLPSLDAFNRALCANKLTVLGSPDPTPSYCLNSIGKTPFMSRELPLPISALAALFINGDVLGMRCGMPVAAKSSPASPEVPLTLQPTTTQLFVLHFMFLDRFPFPKMRDNAINLSAVIDEEDFVRDMFTMPSFSILPGSPAWDPEAWTIEKYFADKWGFLFY